MANKHLERGTLLHGNSHVYHIERVLGHGTFGITYLATSKIKVDGTLGEIETTIKVAIKEFFMHDFNSRSGQTVTSSGDSQLCNNYKRQFIREANNLSLLKHRHIVKVLESFELNNTAYYAMEYCEGGNLNELIAQKGRIGEQQAIEYISQIGEALTEMHANKMLHLDLKPDNVMLRSADDLVLIDFGLSKQFTDKGEPESSTAIGLGTPGYAPLEQTNQQRKFGTLPVTIDVYALGATLFKMLTGQRPPDASSILNDGFPEEELTRVNISAHVIACINKAMSPVKAQRYQNVADFVQALVQQPRVVEAIPIMPEEEQVITASHPNDSGNQKVESDGHTQFDITKDGKQATASAAANNTTALQDILSNLLQATASNAVNNTTAKAQNNAPAKEQPTQPKDEKTVFAGSGVSKEQKPNTPASKQQNAKSDEKTVLTTSQPAARQAAGGAAGKGVGNAPVPPTQKPAPKKKRSITGWIIVVFIVGLFFGFRDIVIEQLLRDKEYYAEDFTEEATAMEVAEQQAAEEAAAAIEAAEQQAAEEAAAAREAAERQAAEEAARREAQQLAAAQQAARDLAAAEAEAEEAAYRAEQERLDQMQRNGGGRDGVYRKGDYYNRHGKEGVVIDVSSDGRSGKIISMRGVSNVAWCTDMDKSAMVAVGATDANKGNHNLQRVKNSGNWQTRFPAFAWCASLGSDWYLPTVNEIKSIGLNFSSVNNTLRNHGGEAVPMEVQMWCSDEISSELATAVLWTIETGLSIDKYAVSKFVKDGMYVRAVATF